MIIKFDERYKDLVCEDVPRERLTSPEARDRHSQEATGTDVCIDPWDGEKPHAKDGFVARYCKETRS